MATRGTLVLELAVAFCCLGSALGNPHTCSADFEDAPTSETAPALLQKRSRLQQKALAERGDLVPERPEHAKQVKQVAEQKIVQRVHSEMVSETKATAKSTQFPCTKWEDMGWYSGTTEIALAPSDAPDGTQWTWRHCAARCAAEPVCEFWVLQRDEGQACLLKSSKGQYYSEGPSFVVAGHKNAACSYEILTESEAVERNTTEPLEAQTSLERAMSRRAYVTMLCITENSTFDRADGLGSEIGTLVHGYMIKRMSPPEMAENVLLRITGGSCKKELSMEPLYRKFYDRVIEVNGSSRLEQTIWSLYKTQPHLWMKLLIMNMTEYDKAMWLGYDTYPIRPLTEHAFDCDSYPCIEPNGNADLMVFEPNATEISRLTDILARDHTQWDGAGGYDMSFLAAVYSNMSRMQLQFETGTGDLPNAVTDIVHFTMYFKPWFQAYCQSLPPNATLPDAEFMGTKEEHDWCLPSHLNKTMYYIFWQAAVEACHPTDPLIHYPMLDFQDFDAPRACRSFVEQFPALQPWCH